MTSSASTDYGIPSTRLELRESRPRSGRGGGCDEINTGNTFEIRESQLDCTEMLRPSFIKFDSGDDPGLSNQFPLLLA